MAGLSQQADEKLRGMPTADGRLEQLESRLTELEAQNHLLEKQRAETEKALADEKRGKEHAITPTPLYLGYSVPFQGWRRRSAP